MAPGSRIPGPTIVDVLLPVLTPAEMAAADRRAVDGGTPIDVLVRRAGHALARAALAELGRGYGRRVAVVAGKGNNGADGRVAARLLAARGVGVDVVDLHPALDRCALRRALGRADLVVDAMFGTGLARPLDGDAAAAVELVHASGRPVLAADIPSGVDGATGATPGPTVDAVATLCFQALKPGHLFEPGRSHGGRVAVADLGIPTDGLHATWSSTADHAAAWAPWRDPSDHKWRSGLRVVGGSRGMVGAPLLTSHAASRSGAGIVHLAVPGADAAARASGTEVVVTELAASPAGALDGEGADRVLDGLDRFGALVVGPGLGRDPATADAVRRLVAAAPIPVVVDADGLDALADHLDVLIGRPAPTVLTPHDGEFTRLAGRPVGDDRLAAARDLAARTGAVVVLKGPGTIVAGPDGRAIVCPRGGPWLGTAGTGDVLAGICGGFLAGRRPPTAGARRAPLAVAEAVDLAAAAVWVHARAADHAGHVGLVATDLPPALPAVLAELAPRAATRPPGAVAEELPCP
jgi:ADP-dependent NAD(P)H-hydrate dehydratase / NAD(P)H-hydrate epimerase